MAISKWTLERKLKSINDQLQQRVTEVTALNRIFQTHLRQRSEIAQAYVDLFTGVRTLLHDTSLLVASGRSRPIAGLNDSPSSDLERE
jgi:hypothetical protein